MRVVIDRRPAGVDAHFARVEGLEGLEAARRACCGGVCLSFSALGKRKIVAEARVWGKGRNGNAIADGFNGERRLWTRLTHGTSYNIARHFEGMRLNQFHGEVNDGSMSGIWREVAMGIE